MLVTLYSYTYCIYCFRKINNLVLIPFAFILWCKRSRVGNSKVVEDRWRENTGRQETGECRRKKAPTPSRPLVHIKHTHKGSVGTLQGDHTGTHTSTPGLFLIKKAFSYKYFVGVRVSIISAQYISLPLNMQLRGKSCMTSQRAPTGGTNHLVEDKTPVPLWYWQASCHSKYNKYFTLPAEICRKFHSCRFVPVVIITV